MGEKQGALLNALVTVIITGFIVFGVDLFFPSLISDLFSGAGDMVSSGFTTIKESMNPSSGYGG